MILLKNGETKCVSPKNTKKSPFGDLLSLSSKNFERGVVLYFFSTHSALQTPNEDVSSASSHEEESVVRISYCIRVPAARLARESAPALL